MVLLYKRKELLKKIHGRGFNTLFKPITHLASKVFGKQVANTIGKSLLRGGVSALGSYAVGKLLPANNMAPTSEIGHQAEEYTLLHNPKLTIVPAPQGVINGDILPQRNMIERISASNNTIDLPGNHEKNVGSYSNVSEIIKRKRNGGGLKEKKKHGGKINKMLNHKSKMILEGILSTKKGNGLRNF